MEASIKIYSEKKKIASFLTSDRGCMTAIAQMKEKNFPFDSRIIHFISDNPLWLPISHEDRKKFCREAVSYLEQYVMQNLDKTAKELGENITFSYGMDFQKTPFICVFLVCIMKSGSYTKSIKKCKGKEIPHVYTVYLMGPKLKSQKPIEGKFVYNINYQKAFTGTMWKSFLDFVKRYGIQTAEVNITIKKELE